MSDEFPGKFVFGALVLTPLVLLTFPISVPAIIAVRAMRHGLEERSSHTGSVFSHSYGAQHGGMHYGSAPSHGFRSSLRSRF